MIPAHCTASRGRPGLASPARAAAAFLVAWALLFDAGGRTLADEALDGYKANLRLQRERYETAMNSLESVDGAEGKSHKCSDIFQFKLVDDRLALEPGISPTPRHTMRRVDLQGVSSPASVTYVASIGRRLGGGYTRF